jgi:hypothetical protein
MVTFHLVNPGATLQVESAALLVRTLTGGRGRKKSGASGEQPDVSLGTVIQSEGRKRGLYKTGYAIIFLSELAR